LEGKLLSENELDEVYREMGKVIAVAGTGSKIGEKALSKKYHLLYFG
jgi:hypothetical protein